MSARGLDNSRYTSILQRLKAVMDVELEWLEHDNTKIFDEKGSVSSIYQ